MGRRWEKDELDLLRADYGRGVLSASDIADAIDRSVTQVRDQARKLGLQSRQTRPARRWTEEELAILRRDYGTRAAEDIAAQLQRGLSAVYLAARNIGLSDSIRPWSEEEYAKLKAMNAEGWPDTHVAKELGRDRHAVSARRKSLGLPSHMKGEKWRQAISAGVKRQCERLGLSSPTELRTAAFRRFARESGWPEDLRPREVQILNVLADRGVPMTRFELAQAIGMRTDRTGNRGNHVTLELLTGNGPGGTYTASLMRRGMLLKLQRAVSGFGQGKNRDLYFLGPAALAILAERAGLEAKDAT